MITDRSGLHSVLYWTKKTYPNIFQVYCKPTANVLFRFAQIRRQKNIKFVPILPFMAKLVSCTFALNLTYLPKDRVQFMFYLVLTGVAKTTSKLSFCMHFAQSASDLLKFSI